MNKLKNISTEDLWAELAHRNESECIAKSMPSSIQELGHAFFMPEIDDIINKEVVKQNFDTEEIWEILLEIHHEHGCIAGSMPSEIEQLGRDHFFDEFEDDIENFTTEELLKELFNYRDVDLDEVMEYMDEDFDDDYMIRELFNCSTYAESEYVKNVIAKTREALINFTYMKSA